MQESLSKMYLSTHYQNILSKMSIAASEEFKKISGVDECIIIQTASRVEIFTSKQY